MPTPRDKALLSVEGRAALLRVTEAVSVREKWRQLEPVVRKGEKGVSKAFQAQGRQFVRAFGELRPRFAESGRLREAWLPEDAWLALWDAVTRATLSLMLAPITEMAETSLTLGAGSLLGQIGIDAAFDLANPRAVAYLAEHGAALVTAINETTREQMRTLLVQAVEDGWSYTRTARAITDQFEGFAGLKPQAHIRNRAELVAVTEAGNAYERGSRIVVDDLQDAGIRMEKKWLTVGDARVSDGCADNEAEGWIPLDQAFGTGHQEPLRFPGCRCTCQYRRAESPSLWS